MNSFEPQEVKEETILGENDLEVWMEVKLENKIKRSKSKEKAAYAFTAFIIKIIYLSP